MKYIISFLIGYLLGCLNLAYVVGKAKGIDMQKSGSKNLGASNATLHLGKKVGALVAFHDIFKTIIAISIVKLMFPSELMLVYITGVASVIGHIFPFWLHFKAGKGFACYIGLILSTTRFEYIISMLSFCIVLMLVTDYVVSATFTNILGLPIYTYISTQNVIYMSIVLIASIVIFIKHIENIKRIVNKEEHHIKQALFKKIQ